MMNSGDEKRIVEKAKQGDDAAFALLVGRYADSTFAFVRRIVASREEAEDAVQETFVKAWSSLRKFDGRSSFQTWLWRIACNTALSAVRRDTAAAKKIVKASDRLWETVPDEDVEAFFAGEADDGRVAALNRAIAALSPDEKALIMLYYYDEKSIAECAAILGLSESNTKVQLHRIRKKLYATIRDER